MAEITRVIEFDLGGAALTQAILDHVYGQCCQARQDDVQSVTITIKQVTPLMLPRLLADYGDRIYRVCDYIEKEMASRCAV